MDAPTTTDVLARTELDLLTEASEAKLAIIVATANALFLRFTGQEWATVEEPLEPLVHRAVQGLSELTAYQQSEDYLETLSDFDLIQNFSAGPYSETRRNPAEAAKARLIVPWPWLSALLWQLLTPDKYDYWVDFFAGTVAPAFAVQEVDWAGDVDIDSAHLWGA
ncbi:MAG: hypothetical protein ABW167_20615 [Baekduia sp.]